MGVSLHGARQTGVLSARQRLAERRAMSIESVWAHACPCSTGDADPMAKKPDDKKKDRLLKLREGRLATPTDLSEEATQTVAGALNGLLADVFALYLKTKNFHWHISGPHFR